MATIITSHLGRAGAGREKRRRRRRRRRGGKKDGTEVEDEGMEARRSSGWRGEDEVSETQELRRNVWEGWDKKCDSSMPGGELFELQTLHLYIIPHLQPNCREC